MFTANLRAKITLNGFFQNGCRQETIGLDRVIQGSEHFLRAFAAPGFNDLYLDVLLPHSLNTCLVVEK